MPELRLDQIIPDPGVHGRTRIRMATVRQYARARGPLPPVSAFRDSNGRYWLADGFLRFYARNSARERTIEVEVFPGERRDAIRFACGANARHGRPPSRQDRRLSAAALLLAPEFADESDTAVADLCGVSRALVAELRPRCAGYERFAEFRAQEIQRQQLARDVRQQHRRQQLADRAASLARKTVSPPAPESPLPPDPSCDQPSPEQPPRELTPREQALAALARAAAAVKRARQAMIQAAQAYPEARSDAAFDGVNESQCCLEDLGVKNEGGRDEKRGARDAKKNKTKSEPSADLVSLARYLSKPVPRDAFFNPRSRPLQPETLHPSPRGIVILPASSKAGLRPHPPPDD